MGRRSASETTIAILTAFVERTSWTQAALARHVGITVPQLRKHLLELVRHGVPLEDEREHPHVVWSVPHGWFPAGITLAASDADELLRQLARAPQSEQRDRLLLELASRARRDPRPAAAHPAGGYDELQLRAVEDACSSRTPLTIRYYSASHGRHHHRVVSVQRIVAGPHPRIIAHCHTAGALRFFRISRIADARPCADTPFVSIDSAEVDAFLATSVAGYRDPDHPVRVSFTVRDPEARWVQDTLPLEMTCEPIPSGIRLSGETAGVLALARFVVGLGAAACAETPELLRAVTDLAAGALAQGGPPATPRTPGPSIRSVAPIRSTDSSTAAD